tara:strand:- start:16085 stop:17752 length:1668 start_codon:yes stop_codon:yes gene_type:complete
MALAVENGEFALWVGSGISKKAPNLGDLILRALEYLRVRAVAAATADVYRPAFENALKIAKIEPDALVKQFGEPIAAWPQHKEIIDELWNNYSRVLDIRIKDESSDFILWDAIDIREAFAHPAPPAAQHLCIAILILEGAIRTVASGNWDGFIEAAIDRLSNGAGGVLQVVVDPHQLRDAAGRARLLKFHGCILYAAQDPATFRPYLTGSHTQIMEWPDNPRFAAMRNAVIDVATNQKSLVLGLSIQDSNLQSIFSKAKQVNPWPWPCEPQAPGHIFCEDNISEGQADVLKIVYGDTYNDHVDAIHADTHLRAWGEQVLIALVLRIIADKLATLMELSLVEAGKSSLTGELVGLLTNLRDFVADLAIGDRTLFTTAAIAFWSRLLSLFRKGALPVNEEVYEVTSNSVPAMLDSDQNAKATGLGRLGAALSLLQHGLAQGLWELGPPAAPDATAGALTARGVWAGATERPMFLVMSATEAIVLERNGAFANDNVIVVHADDAWDRMVGVGASARRSTGAPGRTGRVRTTHVSLGRLIDGSDDVAGLAKQFVAELML